MIKTNTFTGRSILLKNQNEQIFVLNQQTAEKILVYESKADNNMEILCIDRGVIYDDRPPQYKHYLKSKIHIIDEKNNRIIFVKCSAHLIADSGYPPFAIVGIDYKGTHLFCIELEEELEPISIFAYKNGDLILLGKYNRWLGNNGGKSYDCIMRISVEGNIIWKKTKELSCNEFTGTYQMWGYKDNENHYHHFHDWGQLFLTSNDKILIETVYENAKSSYELFASDNEFNAEINGKSLCHQKINSDSLIRMEERYIYIVEDKISVIIRSSFDNTGQKLSEDKIFLKLRPQKIDINIHGIAALYPGYIKYQNFSGIDLSIPLDTEAVTVIKSIFTSKPVIFLFESEGGELAKMIKVFTDEGIVETMVDTNEVGYIQVVCVHDKILCLWNDIMNRKSMLFISMRKI